MSKGKNPHAAYLGQLGGRARKKSLSPERRAEIARTAAKARWAKAKKNGPQKAS